MRKEVQKMKKVKALAIIIAMLTAVILSENYTQAVENTAAV